MAGILPGHQHHRTLSRRATPPSHPQNERLGDGHFKGDVRGLLGLEEKIDTSSAAGELIFHVFGAIAHFERRLIAEPFRVELRSGIERPSRRPPCRCFYKIWTEK
jgi:hypothetical protein